VFWASSLIFLAIIPLIWITKRYRSGGAGGAAAAGAH
jgi:MFS transporter, DHA2 family, multidrug resistance protein